MERDQDGYFVTCPALQGCYSQGDTYEEAIENIKDAIRLHLEDRLAAGEEVPKPLSVSLSTVEMGSNAEVAVPSQSASVSLYELCVGGSFARRR